MVGALQTQKKVTGLRDNPPNAEILVINLGLTGYEVAFFSKDLVVTGAGELAFKEKAGSADNLAYYFNQLVAEFNLTKTNFLSICINWSGKNFTLVPSAYYKPDKAKELLEFNTGKMEEETVCVNDVKPDIKLLFSIPTELKSVIDRIFPQHELKHSGTCAINLFFTHFQLKKANVYLNLQEGQIELLVKNDKQLLLYNIFETKSNEDILYYLLFSVEQFRLDPASLHLSISGNRETDDELFTAIRKYVRHVSFAVSDKLIQRKEAFETMPHHFYFSLLNRPLCE